MTKFNAFFSKFIKLKSYLNVCNNRMKVESVLFVFACDYNFK